ncbi:uncharacterized protein LOC120664005 [Panicum virgatum]|uniref:uncharacterized protein LOC120664005 n=1 Tax=Panicum virgatum TaxID=38727 RepID=UPI0019D65445|nr:uncharacterized protein LOC120664005 [Panicum virgatum]
MASTRFMSGTNSNAWSRAAPGPCLRTCSAPPLRPDGMRESGRRDAGEGDLQDVCSRLLLRPSATLIWLRLDGPDGGIAKNGRGKSFLASRWIHQEIMVVELLLVTCQAPLI